MACLNLRFICWVKNGPLTNNTSKHVSKNRSFANVRIVGKRQTLFETTFTIGRDQMCQAGDDEFTKFRFILSDKNLLCKVSK